MEVRHCPPPLKPTTATKQNPLQHSISSSAIHSPYTLFKTGLTSVESYSRHFPLKFTEIACWIAGKAHSFLQENHYQQQKFLQALFFLHSPSMLVHFASLTEAPFQDSHNPSSYSLFHRTGSIDFGKDLENSSSSSLLKAGHLEQVAQVHVQSCFEYLQG